MFFTTKNTEDKKQKKKQAGQCNGETKIFNKAFSEYFVRNTEVHHIVPGLVSITCNFRYRGSEERVRVLK